MSMRRLERELTEETIPQRHKSRMMGKVKVRAVELWLAAAFCLATCGQPSDSCDLHRGPWCLSKQAHTLQHICRTLTDAESSICIVCCYPVSCEWAERSSVCSSVSRLLAAKTFLTFQVPQSVSALKIIACFGFYSLSPLHIITKKTPFRMGTITHSHAGRRGVARVTERFGSERMLA